MKILSNAVQWQRLHTRLGWWSLRLAARFVLLFVINLDTYANEELH